MCNNVLEDPSATAGLLVGGMGPLMAACDVVGPKTSAGVLMGRERVSAKEFSYSYQQCLGVPVCPHP